MANAPYNYQHFSPQSYDFTKQTGLGVGDKLPKLTLTDLRGQDVELENYFGHIFVLETGSITCPLYVGKIKSMNALAQQHPDVQFLVLYIREAHPGKKIPSHEGMQNKINNANRLAAKEPENRTILIDDVKGSLHTTLGLLPNMAYVFNEDGVVLYRADWNIPERINDVINAAKAKTSIPSAPADFTPVAPIYSLRVLARSGGVAAVWEFITHLPKLIEQHKAHKKHNN